MAYRVKLTLRARHDLSGIYQWLGANSLSPASTWYRGLREAINSLSDNPNRCPVTIEDPSLRHLLYGKKPHIYRAIFRVIESQKQVHVLHIRHGARKGFQSGDLK
jgi:plasmid stabilization system protein ParE